MPSLTFVRTNEKNTSALCMLKKNPFELSGIPVYVAAYPFLGKEKGYSCDIPEGYKLEPIIVNGEPALTADGIQKQKLVW